MKIKFLVLVAITVSVFLAAGAANAETELMILLDASNSMTAPGTPGTSHNKFDEVRVAVNTLLQNIPPDVAVGLRLMGSSPAADCYFSFMYSTPEVGERSRMQDFLATVRPAGARALYQGIDDCMTDFEQSHIDADRILLVITDGGDSCDRDMDTLATQYRYNSDAPQIIVFGLDLDQESRDAIIEVVTATGGRLTNIDDIEELSGLLSAFSDEFENNLRIYLADSDGNAVEGDLVIEDSSSGQVVAEVLDVTEHSLNLEPGSYVVKGRYLGQEVRSETIVVTSSGNYSVNLEFNIYLEPFTLILKDMYEQPLRARVTFINSSSDPVLTTDIGTSHRVNLPPGTYSVQIRLGDLTYDFPGILVGPMYESRYELEVPVALGVLEVEVANIWGTPLNAKVTVYDTDGSIMDEAPYTSYLYAKVPPGEYRIVADFHGTTVERTVQLLSGDEMQVPLEITVDLGDIYVELRTESGDEAWGWVKLYDSDGNLYDRYDRETIEQPEWSFADIPVGTYKLEAEADGVVRVVTGVVVRANEETYVLVEFPDEVY